jgi:hypothetical protein
MESSAFQLEEGADMFLQMAQQQIIDEEAKKKRNIETYNNQVATRVVEKFYQATEKLIERRDNIKERIVEKLGGQMQSETSLIDNEDTAAVAAVIGRLQTAQRDIMSKPVFYNSKEDNKSRHFFYQLLSDPELGENDPTLALIAKLLKIPLNTLMKTARERKEHHLGYYFEPEVHGNTTPAWVIEVKVTFI